jgi:hypothetical protein
MMMQIEFDAMLIEIYYMILGGLVSKNAMFVSGKFGKVVKDKVQMDKGKRPKKLVKWPKTANSVKISTNTKKV